MKTSIEIDEEIVKKVIEETGEKTMRKAIASALRDYLSYKKRKELASMIGNYKEFSLSLKELSRLRDGR